MALHAMGPSVQACQMADHVLRTPLASERIQRTDPDTGIEVIQLTSYPAPSAHFPYDWPSITPDNRRAVIFCQRFARRDAPWDLFRVDTDGLNLYQLTERGDACEHGGYYGRPAARLTLDGRTVYCVWGTEVCAVDVQTGGIEELSSLGEHCPKGSVIGNLHMSANGSRLFAIHGRNHRGVVRLDLDTMEATNMAIDGQLFSCDPTGPRLMVTKGTVQWGTIEGEHGSRLVVNKGELRSKWMADENGKDIEYFGPEMYAHATLLGRHLKIQGCGLPPRKCIWLVEKDRDPRSLVEGPYFWHSGSSWDGEWIAADTNWPDEGIQLVHVSTGHFATLCHAGATQDHYEFGHPHPTLSQDGSLCLFRSDRTGVPQIHIAHITKGFKKQIVRGESPPCRG